MGQYPQAGYAGPAPILPQPVSGDIFGVGLGGPARYTTPYMSMQNAHAGPSHLQPPQRDLHGTGLNPPMPPMAPPQYLPPCPDLLIWVMMPLRGKCTQLAMLLGLSQRSILITGPFVP